MVSILLLSSCSWRPEKEIVTVEKIITPTIAIAQKPKPLKMLDTKVTVITEKNLPEVVEKVKAGMGEFVIYGLDPQSFKNLALNFEQIKKYIEQQNEIILYYEEGMHFQLIGYFYKNKMNTVFNRHELPEKLIEIYKKSMKINENS